MRILRTPAYCYPELTASSHLEDDRFEVFSKSGIETIIYTPTPTRGISREDYRKYKKIKYQEFNGGFVKVNRFSMFRERRNPIVRAFRYILVNLIQYRKAKKTKAIDVVYGSSTPPTQGVLCAKVAKKLSKKYGRKVPFVYNLQDVFPDSLVTTGLAKKGGLFWKIGRKIENYTYKNADKIIVISESMKKNILDKGVPAEKIEVISNWIDTDATRPVPNEENRIFEEFALSKEKFTVVYAGNFGKAQGADVVLEAADKLKENDNIQFVIFGGGAEFNKAKEKAASLNNVTINSLLPQERVPEVYSLGDTAIITCKKGVGTSGMPSKTWSIMACNTPIIAAFDTDSELADVIERANAGVTVEPENVDALTAAILEMSRGRAEGFTGGREYTVKNASKDVCTAKYVETLKSVVMEKEDATV